MHNSQFALFLRRIGYTLLKIAAVVLLLGTLGIAGLLLHEGWLAAGADRWTRTEAIVIHMGAIQRAGERDYLDLTYEYIVNGRAYQSDRTHFFNMFGMQTVTELRVLQTAYPTGSLMPVYYHPQRPGQAIVDPEFDAGEWFAVAAATVCAVIPGIFMLGAPGYLVLNEWLRRR